MSEFNMTQLDQDIDTLRDVYMTNSQREALARVQALASDHARLTELLGNSEQLPPAPAADPEDVRIVRIIAEKIDEGRLDHPGFYKNGRLSAALRNLLALIDGQSVSEKPQKRRCPNNVAAGGCQLPNRFCTFPDCEKADKLLPTKGEGE